LAVKRLSPIQRGLAIGDLSNRNGAGGRTRTDDLLITNQLLYQLSYAGRRVPSVRLPPPLVELERAKKADTTYGERNEETNCNR
jgi:hypothetical protein